MARRLFGVLAVVLAGSLGCGPRVVDAAARALAYPQSWPTPVAATCADLRGTYRNHAIAVEDAGHGLLALSLATLLRASPGLPGPPAPAAALDHGQATSAQRRSDAEANRVRETIEFANMSEELWTVTVAGAAATPLTTVRCGSKRRTKSMMEIDEISLIENMAADDPLAHLGRIGLRRVKIALHGTVAGDLIVELIVTQRLTRFDVFGYPAVKRYWLRYARVDEPTHRLASDLPALP